MKESRVTILKGLQIFFYLGFVFLWFKDNYAQTRNINISFLLPLVPLLLITFARIYFNWKKGKLSFRLKIDKSVLTLLLIVLVIIAFRIPYLANSYGLMESDAGISALMGKHISEGKTPPLFWYGDYYDGSLSAHYYGLVFKIFGFSVLSLKASVLLLFLGFVAIQFFLLKNIFNLKYALVVCLFYALPVGHVIAVSFENGTGYPTVLFLGGIIIYLSYLIHYQNKMNLVPTLGFIMGLGFWSQFVFFYFIAVSLILVILKFRFNVKKWLTLVFYALIGMFPAIYSEIFTDFSLFKFLFGGSYGSLFSWEKLKRTVESVLFLFVDKLNFFNYLYLFLILSSLLFALYAVVKKKKLEAQNIHVLFFLFFLGIFFFSKFSMHDPLRVRYVYPLFFSLPVVLTFIFLQIRKRSKYILMVALLLILFVFSNAKGAWKSFELIREAHYNMKKTVNLMVESQNKYWFGEYWSAMVLTALSGEKVIVFPYSMHYYLPYEIDYFNNRKNQSHGLVFLREIGIYALLYKEELEKLDSEWLSRKFERVSNFTKLLDRLEMPIEIKKIDRSFLVYGIEGKVPYNAIDANIPYSIPHIALDRIEKSMGHLDLFFQTSNIPENAVFRLHVEIPAYSSVFRPVSLDKKEIKITLPYPEKDSFKIQYYLEYASLKINSTHHELDYTPVGKELKKESKRPFYTLYGFGPRVRLSGKKMLLCEKEFGFQINPMIPREGNLMIHLYSPLDFSSQFWYGKFSQEVGIYVNDFFLKTQKLKYGQNVIRIPLAISQIKNKENTFQLKFKYTLPFDFAPFWLTAALLDKIEMLTPLKKFTWFESKSVSDN